MPGLSETIEVKFGIDKKKLEILKKLLSDWQKAIEKYEESLKKCNSLKEHRQ